MKHYAVFIRRTGLNYWLFVAYVNHDRAIRGLRREYGSYCDVAVVEGEQSTAEDEIEWGRITIFACE